MPDFSSRHILDFVVALVAAAAVFFWWVANRRRIAAETVGAAEQQASRLIRDAEREADARKKEALIEAKEKAHDLMVDAERLARDRRTEVQRVEQSLAERTQALADRLQMAERVDRELRAREQNLSAKERTIEATKEKFERLVVDQQREFQRVASMTADEAKDVLLKQIEADARRDGAALVKRLDSEARETAALRARQVITEAIQRSAAERAIETTVSVVDLPSDDMKGRIIGREGRNIRALELATGVELIVDDTPGAIILSSFDPFRREIARLAIERLIADGRIHPARIEEVVEKVKAELDTLALKEGESAAFELGLYDLHPEITRLMGRLKFRTSYGQNVLNHSKEVAFLAGIMAKEVGLDAHVTTRAAFVHDIGKAIDRDLSGTHLELGIDFLRKHGESEPVVMAMAAHHMDIDWPSLEAMIVQAADAISAARPGARRDILESYVKRLEKLEGIADSFKGVSKAFALQAGREIRILVESEKISDEEAVWLSKDIARRIENELEYPGQIKVTVIRETRAVEYTPVSLAATVADCDERGLIARIRARLPSPPPFVALGIGDDAAVVVPEPRTADVLTADALVEGVHFTWALTTPEDVGAKAIAVNVSDIASMGARPRTALLSLALPPTLPLAWFDGLADGLAAEAAAHRVQLVGGNLTRSPGPLMVDVTIVGAVHPRKVLSRKGGRPGDELYVSGRAGGAAAGLKWLAANAERTIRLVAEPEGPLADAVRRWRRPDPRLRLGSLVGRTRSATACMDTSDGLADAARQIAEASGTGVIIDGGHVPVHPAVRAVAPDEELRFALEGGEDYELVCAVAPGRRRAFLDAARRSGVGVTRFGRLTRDRALLVQHEGGTTELARGFRHFA